MSKILLILCVLVAGPADGVRMAALRSQLERLRTIEVTPDAQARATADLESLASQLLEGVSSDEELNAFYTRMDELRSWLLAHAVERPLPGGGEFTKTSDGWRVKNTQLTLTIGRKDLSMTVETARGQWQWRPGDDKDVELRDGKTFALASAGKRQADAFNTGFSAGMRLSLSDFPAAPAARIDVIVHLIQQEAVFEIVPVQDIEALAVIAFPKPLDIGNLETDIAVIPRMQGILIPGNWKQEIRYRELTNGRALYMPWWGQISGGRGVQTILETQDDAGVEYIHPSGGPTRIQPLWYSSLNRLRYPRFVRYVFDDQATYVRMAKRYRRYVQETGNFVSLTEKRARTPLLDKVIGKPVIHTGALYHQVEGSRFFNSTHKERNHQITTFDAIATALRSLKQSGIDEAYVHLDGWGFYGYDNGHPDVIPPGPEQGGWEGFRRLADTCDEIGYLFALHDQYRDFYLAAASYDEKLSVRNWDGSRTVHAEWAGGKQTLLSPRFAPGYVRRNHDAFAERGIKVRGAYLDVFAVVPLEESFQSSHPVTRSDCARYRRECFDLLRARGYVVSSEEPADYLTRSLDLVHHGPYPTVPKGYGPGDAQGIPVPLFNLVYHDSLLIPWYITDNGGWGIPNGDSGRLHCILNTGLPYISPGTGKEQIALVQEICALARRLGTQEMTDHVFLDGTRRIQQTTFADGTRITIDLDKKTHQVASPEAR